MNKLPDYTAKKISSAIIIDGDVTKPIWQQTPWSNRFVDMVSAAAGMYNTQAAILWND